MSFSVIPLFHDDSADRGKSILTWDLYKDPQKDYIPGGPIPIMKLLKENDLKEVFFIATNFHSFAKAYKQCKEAGVILHFGLEFWITDDAARLDEPSKANESKVIVWMKDGSGYQDLIRVYEGYSTKPEYFYYHQRFDWKGLKSVWNNKTLILSAPFFDSFLARNTLNYGASIVPDLPDLGDGGKFILFKDLETHHPHEALINYALNRYSKTNPETVEIVPSKNIYYLDETEMEAYITYRCIKNKSTFDKPELPFMCSDRFSFKAWKELESTTSKISSQIS